MNDQSGGIIDRTLRRFRRAWRFSGGGALKERVEPDLPEDDAGRLRRRINDCLEARGGEVSARARAAELGETYLVLDPTGRRRFLDILAREYGVDPARVDAAIGRLTQAAPGAERRGAERALREALVPPRVRLLAQFNDLSQGVKFLVDLRAELHAVAGEDEDLRGLDADLRDLLASWFDVGFLDLTRIAWNTPASLLEKLIEYEAVHAIRSWDDLKNRLEVDRRCYAFFHPNMPDEPLIFVQVALVDGMADNVQRLLDEGAPMGDPEHADTAIFYSISNCQSGLAGVSFGSFLIKRVADDLARDLPNLKNFATLSPIPGFRRWLDARLAADDGDEELLTEAESKALAEVAESKDGRAALATLLGRARWWLDGATAAALRPALTRLGAHYLLRERRSGRARDRVAHFHLSNGARVERLNWLGDTSDKGIAESAGLMVNYRYRLADIERNHESYTGEGKVTAASAVRKLLKR